jgi:hypothetical protein
MNEKNEEENKKENEKEEENNKNYCKTNNYNISGQPNQICIMKIINQTRIK